jgi:hypothetical protein
LSRLPPVAAEETCRFFDQDIAKRDVTLITQMTERVALSEVFYSDDRIRHDYKTTDN